MRLAKVAAMMAISQMVKDSGVAETIQIISAPKAATLDFYPEPSAVKMTSTKRNGKRKRNPDRWR